MHLGSAIRARGLTLIELLVVMAVIAAASVMVMPAVASLTGANARKTAGELSGSMRALFDLAALRHVECRLALDLEKRTRWAECASADAAAPGADAESDDDLEDRFPDVSDPDVRRRLARSRFGRFKDRLIPEGELPRSAKFGPVHLEGRRDAVETGIVYVHFFPGGRAERAWVPVVDGKHVFTVVTEPFTGRTRVVAGKVEVKE